MTKNQHITEDYAIYNSDAMEILPTLADESIDFSAYSPPFHNLYTYSSSPRDLSNCDSMDQFVTQYGFIVEQMARITKKGRINAIHVTDYCQVDGTLKDFPAKIIQVHQKYGFELMSRVTVWKEPLKLRIRTMVQSLMHKFIVEDSTKSFPSNPDYILIFKKRGENKVPVTHSSGLKNYAGDTPIIPNILTAWNNANGSKFTAEELWEYLNKKYKNWDDPKTNKLSHIIWQRYASSIWDDIRDSHLLPYRDSKEDDDESHVTPTQIDVFDRLLDLYTNPGEVVLSPFSGVGTDIYAPVSMGRKAIGIELKESYYKQSVLNMAHAKSRFENQGEQAKLF